MSKHDIWTLSKDGFSLEKPLLYRPWINYLENGSYGLRISHLGDAVASTLGNPRVAVTNYDFWEPSMGRFLYVQDEEGHWSPSFLPSEVTLDEYNCVHSPGSTRFTSSLRGIMVESTHFLPTEGSFEIWKISLTNKSSKRRALSLYTLTEMLLYPNHGVDPTYFSWFTNSSYDSEYNTLAYTRANDADVYGFIRTLGDPVGYEASYIDFRGNGTLRNPEGVVNRGLKNSHSGGDRMAGVFHFSATLEPEESVTYALIIGVGKDAQKMAIDGFPTITSIDTEYQRVRDMWKKRVHHNTLSTLGESEFASYLQSFFPYQVIQQGLGMVRNPFRGFRDVAQDVMGLCPFSLEGAKSLIRELPERMFESGRSLRQWNTSGGYQDKRDFHDLGPWLILAVDRYLSQGGDTSILHEEFGYFQSEKRDTLFDHMVKGVEYSLSFGPHNLLEIGEGDWNDALSGLGPKGESLWLSEFLYYALGLLQNIANTAQLPLSMDVPATRERLYQGVMDNWSGSWFVRGYAEDGSVIGGSDRIFLLPQAWFTISGMAERDPERGKIALESMTRELRSDFGLLLCHPPFDTYDPKIGNLSALAPGMAENFAVYNHGSMFGVYSLFQAGMIDEAIEFFLKVLPLTKDITQTLAEPYVLVNFYNGGYYPEKTGRGGIPWLTGTVAWLGMALFDYILPLGLYPRVEKEIEAIRNR